MMGGGDVTASEGAQDSQPGLTGKNPGGASSLGNLGVGWTQLVAFQTGGAFGDPVVFRGNPALWGHERG